MSKGITMNDTGRCSRIDKLLEEGSSFAKARREDIIGIDSILDQIDPIIYWLKNCSDMKNSRATPGILFSGSPGTGKTLCSRYIATESNARFINVRDWPHRQELTSSDDIKEIFQSCRHYFETTKIPVILFWDEFETFAKERGSGLSIRDGGIVSQLTAELDGVNGKSEGILFVGCTNYKDVIDRALLRPGRMGLHINCIPPDREGKQNLLIHYLSKFEISDIDFESASFFFEDEDNASAIEEAANKIWLDAVIEGIKSEREAKITNEIVHRVLLEILLGPPSPFLRVDKKSLLHIAVHEIGHALVARHLEIPIRIITVQPGERTLGRTFTRNINERLQTIDDSISKIKISLGSIYAEREAGLPNLVNSSKDVYQANEIAHLLTGSLGTHSDGMVSQHVDFAAYDVKNRSMASPMSEAAKTMFDQRLISLIKECEVDVEAIIKNIGRDKINHLANKLVEDKTWTGKDFERVIKEIH